MSFTSTKWAADRENLNLATFAAFLFKISVFVSFVIFCEISIRSAGKKFFRPFVLNPGTRSSTHRKPKPGFSTNKPIPKEQQ